MTKELTKEEKVELIRKLEAEHASVNERFQRLDAFIMSDRYQELPAEDRVDLSAQWRYMDGYVSILMRRISRLKGVVIGD